MVVKRWPRLSQVRAPELVVSGTESPLEFSRLDAILQSTFKAKHALPDDGQHIQLDKSDFQIRTSE